MEYSHILQESDRFCVPACLQIILKRREIPFDSQIKIFDEFGEKGSSGLKLKKDELDKYFISKNIPLCALSFPISESFFRDYDFFTREALSLNCDIITTYAYDKLHKTPGEGNHASLVIHSTATSFLLLDPDSKTNKSYSVSIDDLVNAMHVVSGGFHCVNEDLDLLKRLNKNW
jgi:hypothetical protein